MIGFSSLLNRLTPVHADICKVRFFIFRSVTITNRIGIYSIFLIYSDFNTVIDNSLNFNYFFIPLILLTVFSSWIFLFFRWSILLKNSNIEIPFKDNFLIYLSGFTFSISPGKSGEWIRPSE